MSDVLTFDREAMRRVIATVRGFEHQLKQLAAQTSAHRGNSGRPILIGVTLDEITRGDDADLTNIIPATYRVEALGRRANGTWFKTGEIRDCEEIGMIRASMTPVPIGTKSYQVWANGAWIYDGHDCQTEE